ncbi:hypothetical protein GCM10010507_06470 [Streptomyces cinnamoneus]|uniref:Uncharacterized protein n=1 Tax=Streptomyces cinnamoneus TaxID=53446 RepID=A0A918TB14_STRCJ|nr:hypothetical protein GCM10010507_06470 [Streptomyces cinnamoneus]
MIDDVGTSCATTNATPETSFAPRQGMDAPMDWTGNRPTSTRWGTHAARLRSERAGALHVMAATRAPAG